MSNKDKSVVAFDPTKFKVDMPPNAPALGFDPAASFFSWQSVYPANFWNMDDLEKRKAQLGGWPVLTPSYVALQPVYDPADEHPDMSGKLVLYFREAAPALVLNKSRCQMCEEISGTPNPTQWAAALGRVMLSVGVYNRKAQIIIDSVDSSSGVKAEPVDNVNDVLFG